MVYGMKKILIVEDNANLCELLTIIITRSGYEVAAAKTGEEAVEMASAIRPDLILMDIGLPQLSGVEATKQIKANPSTKDIPVAVLSALPMSSHGKPAIEAGAVAVLQKPVSVADIEQILSKYTSGSKPSMKSFVDSLSGARSCQTTSILR